MTALPSAPLVVLVDENVIPEFRSALAGLGQDWQAPTGRRYRLALAGERLEVALLLDPLAAPPPKRDVDDDLFELACVLQDAAGPPWSAAALRALAEQWGRNA